MPRPQRASCEALEARRWRMSAAPTEEDGSDVGEGEQQQQGEKTVAAERAAKLQLCCAVIMITMVIVEVS